MKDMEKRRRVMQRSMQLGHCICDPKKPCPCDVFHEQDLCPCAGERPEPQAGPVRLTSLVESAGCASKIDQATLRRVLTGLPSLDDPRVLVGMPAGDDAGVFRIDGDLAGGETALVQTVDVFSPSVDDPYVFGQIAAANSLSDVYAMGGRAITALSIIGFPARTLPDEIMREILRGGIDKMAEAGVPVIGGHSINDKEIKAGFAVTGLVNPNRIFTNAAARPGDLLILTKPIGTGIIAFASQIDRAPAGSMEAAGRWMATLNKRAAELMIECGANACTDITGFGLMGHLASLARSSGADVEIVWDEIPLLPGVLECAADGILPGAIERNRESSGDALIADGSLRPQMLDICFDAQTSGGLLIAVPERAAETLLQRLHAEGISESAVIGRVIGPGPGRVTVRSNGRRQFPQRPASRRVSVPVIPAAPADEPASCCAGQETNAMSCCEDSQPVPAAEVDKGGVRETQEKFQAFLKASGAPGLLDARTRQAIAIALSVLSKCEPCLKSHIKKAKDMGFSQGEIDEAAWQAIGFGGSPTMMFYGNVKKEVLQKG